MTNDKRQLNIGIRIMQKRKEKGYTQKELAELADMTDHQISNIERGFNFPRMGTFLTLCEILDTPPEYFLAGTIKRELSSNIIELIEYCSEEEQKTIWLIIDTHIHRNDDERV